MNDTTLTTDELEALAALRTRSDWQTGGQPQLMCLSYQRYGWTLNEVRAEYYKACNELVLAHRAGMTLAEYQVARIIEEAEF